MLDRDLAELYCVSTKALNQAVKRNTGRFPMDFMFRLTNKEKDELVTNCDRFKTLKHSTAMPNVLTEHGILMLSSVLNSEHAIQINIAIVRIFIKLRELFFNHKKLAIKLSELERKVENHDGEIKAIFDVIRQLMTPTPEKSKRKIGFQYDKA